MKRSLQPRQALAGAEDAGPTQQTMLAPGERNTRIGCKALWVNVKIKHWAIVPLQKKKIRERNLGWTCMKPAATYVRRCSSSIGVDPTRTSTTLGLLRGTPICLWVVPLSEALGVLSNDCYSSLKPTLNWRPTSFLNGKYGAISLGLTHVPTLRIHITSSVSRPSSAFMKYFLNLESR